MAQQGLIFQVPNEILLKIFNEIVLPEAPYQLTWPLALTCKRFYTLAQPIVWSHVTFQNDDWDQDPLWKQPGHKARVRSQRTRECLKIAPHCVSYAKRVSLLGRGEIGFKNAIDVVQDFPNLKRLDIESVRNISRIWDESSRRGDRYVVEDPKIAAPPPGLEGSAGFDELHVSRFKFGSPDALRNFLLWPKSLTVFSIDELASGGLTWDYL
ncbi:hypothetical protein PFICI_03397 [Pestalotiopsis fici W106-1]|uniref:F-box domain-containing protein n=1 Tax=Pestalotiopsis fici (strain W106-1 / CGMCC3.15140) TaxID=1229662 RepID=W3XIW1_PESFW|nr:uncharacterized protein PFICI_03397 [Pestalotiopsis fici W106-1]ETS85372.1 hypothetical protein PFICI_03397 [Pestalotiopsis fici W106-1]